MLLKQHALSVLRNINLRHGEIFPQGDYQQAISLTDLNKMITEQDSALFSKNAPAGRLFLVLMNLPLRLLLITY
jgi:hypothetical protein